LLFPQWLSKLPFSVLHVSFRWQAAQNSWPRLACGKLRKSNKRQVTDSLSKCNSEKCFIYSKCSETSKLFFQCTRNEMSEIEAWVDRFIQIIARIFTTRNSRLCIHSNAGKICYMIRYIKHSNWFWQFRLHLLFFTHFTSAYHYHLFR